MTLPAILAPIFVQVALTFGLMLAMGRARFAAARAGQVALKDIALGERAWPPKVQQIVNAFHNQLELPLLFYALTAFAVLARKADLLFVMMAWAFVLTRFVHAYIYVTSNVVMRRFQAFLAGALILLAMWLIFAVRVLFGAGA